MKVINVKKLKVILFIAIVTITLVIFLSFLKFSNRNKKSDLEELVLEMAPEDLLSPSVLFKKTSSSDLEYRIDESGNLLFRDKNGKLYTISPNGDVYEIQENGEKTLVTDSSLRNKIILSTLEEGEKNPYISALFSGNEGTILNKLDQEKLTQKDQRRVEKIVSDILSEKKKAIQKAYSDLLLTSNTPITVDELQNLLNKTGYSDEEFLRLVEKLGVDGAIDFLKNKAEENSNGKSPSASLNEKLGFNKKNETERKSFVVTLPTKASASSLNASYKTNRDDSSSSPMFSQSDTLSLLKESTKSAYDAQNAQSAKENFLKNRSDVKFSEIDEYTIMPGTIIPLTLITSINTDLPGVLLAQVNTNIYDSLTGKNLLIEKGEKVTGRYNSSISYAQDRVQVVWESLQKNNGLVIPLQNVIGVDEEGKSGYSGATNRHILGTVTASGASLLLNVGTSAISDISKSSIVNSLLNGVTNTTQSVASTFIEKELDRQPTITIEKGTKVNAFVNSTIQMFSNML